MVRGKFSGKWRCLLEMVQLKKAKKESKMSYPRDKGTRQMSSIEWSSARWRRKRMTERMHRRCWNKKILKEAQVFRNLEMPSGSSAGRKRQAVVTGNYERLQRWNEEEVFMKLNEPSGNGADRKRQTEVTGNGGRLQCWNEKLFRVCKMALQRNITPQAADRRLVRLK